MNIGQTIFLAIFIAMSLVSFTLMGIDKYLAVHNKYRISEKVLFLFALLFGAVGGTIGMFSFRHKTQHLYFVIVFPILAIFDIVAFGIGMFYMGVLL